MTNEELVQRIAAGEESLIVDLWTQIEEYTKWKAKQFFFAFQNRCAKLGIEIDDLCQEGYFAMLLAVEKFDPLRGKKFIVFFAYCLKTRFYKLAKMHYQGWAKNKVYDCDSLDVLISTAEGLSLKDTIAYEDNGLEEVETNVYWEAVSPTISEALNSLTNRQLQIITSLYYEGKTFEATARRYGISKGAVEVYKRASLKKLRNNAELCAVCAY